MLGFRVPFFFSSRKLMAHDDTGTEKKALQWSDLNCRRCFVPYEHVLTWTESFLFARFKIKPTSKPGFSNSDPTVLMTVQIPTEWLSLLEIPHLRCSVPLLLLYFSFIYVSSHFTVNGRIYMWLDHDFWKLFFLY